MVIMKTEESSSEGFGRLGSLAIPKNNLDLMLSRQHLALLQPSYLQSEQPRGGSFEGI
jgi:hypothetical protein